MMPFPNTAGCSINPLVTESHHTALQDLWGWPALWKVPGRCCTGPRSGYPGWVLLLCLVWHDDRTGIDTQKVVSGWLAWGCRITENTLPKWMCASLYTNIYPSWGVKWQPGWVFRAVLRDMAPDNRQIWGSSCGASKLIYCFMGIIVAISCHCLLVLLVTPPWIATMQRK